MGAPHSPESGSTAQGGRTPVRLEPVDTRLDWRGVVEFEYVEPGWWQPWRLPARQVSTASMGNLADRAQDAAGVRLIVGPGVTALTLAVRGQPEAPLDVLVDGKLAERVRIDGRQTVTVPAAAEIWLPQFGHVQVGHVELEGFAVPSPENVHWITYGSSITQCRGADGPSETWPALVARATGWDVTALGFGGECHLDPVAATTIRDRRAHLISLCLGVNIHGHSTFSARTLTPAIGGFLERIRERHDCPILLIGPIASPANERRVNEVGLTLEAVRDLVREEATRNGVSYLDGRTLISESEASLLADGVHPTAHGYRLLAERVTPVLTRLRSPAASRNE